MSMTARLRRLSDEDLERLCDEPGHVDDYLDARAPLDGFGPIQEFDLGTAWHAIHFLLTGSAWKGAPPLNFIISGGSELGEDRGRGPARGLLNLEVRSVAAALQALPPEVLMRRFDPALLVAADIGLPAASVPSQPRAPRDLIENSYRALRAFVIDAAESGDGLLVALG